MIANELTAPDGPMVKLTPTTPGGAAGARGGRIEKAATNGGTHFPYKGRSDDALAALVEEALRDARAGRTGIAM